MHAYIHVHVHTYIHICTCKCNPEVVHLLIGGGFEKKNSLTFGGRKLELRIRLRIAHIVLRHSRNVEITSVRVRVYFVKDGLCVEGSLPSYN